MAAYAKPQQWEKRKRERLRGEREQIKFIDLSLLCWYDVPFEELSISGNDSDNDSING